jgi:hypothetical protein
MLLVLGLIAMTFSRALMLPAALRKRPVNQRQLVLRERDGDRQLPLRGVSARGHDYAHNEEKQRDELPHRSRLTDRMALIMMGSPSAGLTRPLPEGTAVGSAVRSY